MDAESSMLLTFHTQLTSPEEGSCRSRQAVPLEIVQGTPVRFKELYKTA